MQGSCATPPICGRLAVGLLSGMQGLAYSTMTMPGLRGYSANSRNFVFDERTGTIGHTQCTKRVFDSKKDTGVCFLYTSCFREAMKLVCRELPDCCPKVSPEACHSIDAATFLKNPDVCNTCSRARGSLFKR